MMQESNLDSGDEVNAPDHSPAAKARGAKAAMGRLGVMYFTYVRCPACYVVAA
jgi:hypothetical protein